MAHLDPSLYLIVDPAQCHHATPGEVARLSVAGGTTLVQVRDKRSSTRELIAHARSIIEAVSATRVPVVINDRVDVALASGAAGVHLGQDDMEVDTARRLLGEDAIIGLTVHSHAEVDDAPLEVVDYISVGGIFATRSKRNPDPPIGLEGFVHIVDRIRQLRPQLPVVAISGITLETVGPLIAAGADGVAVISAVSDDPDHQAATTRLRDAIDAERMEASR